MTCEKCRSLLSGFLDGALSAGESSRVTEHLGGCAGCREQLAGLERIDRAMEALVTPVPPRGYLEELRARVLERTAASESELSRGEAMRSPGQAPRPKIQAPLWQRLVPLAAAALVAIIVLRVADLYPPGALKSPREAKAPMHDQKNEPSPEVRTASPGIHEKAPPPAVAEKPKAEAAGEAIQGARGKEAFRERSADRAASRAAPSAMSKLSEPSPSEEVEANERAAAQAPSAARARYKAPADKNPLAKDAASLPPGEPSPPLDRKEDFALEAPDLNATFAETPELRRAEGLLAVHRLDEARAVLDSVLDAEPAPPVAAGARLLEITADEIELGDTGGKTRTAGEAMSRDEARSGLRLNSAQTGGGLDSEALRRLGDAYAGVADRWPATPAGREAALRAARIALDLWHKTGAAEDCLLARGRLDALVARYPEEVRADSLAARRGELDCPTSEQRAR